MFNKKYKEQFSVIEKSGIIIVIASSWLSVLTFTDIVWGLFSELLGEGKIVIFFIIMIYSFVVLIGTIKIGDVFFKKYNEFNEEIDD